MEERKDKNKQNIKTKCEGKRWPISRLSHQHASVTWNFCYLGFFCTDTALLRPALLTDNGGEPGLPGPSPRGKAAHNQCQSAAVGFISHDIRSSFFPALENTADQNSMSKKQPQGEL